MTEHARDLPEFLHDAHTSSKAALNLAMPTCPRRLGGFSRRRSQGLIGTRRTTCGKSASMLAAGIAKFANRASQLISERSRRLATRFLRSRCSPSVSAPTRGAYPGTKSAPPTSVLQSVSRERFHDPLGTPVTTSQQNAAIEFANARVNRRKGQICVERIAFPIEKQSSAAQVWEDIFFHGPQKLRPSQAHWPEAAPRNAGTQACESCGDDGSQTP